MKPKAKTEKPAILVQRYPSITPMQALKLLRELDYLAGRRAVGACPNVNCEIEIRDALAAHVRSALK